MQITTFSDYCLRILIFLAVSDGQQASSREIAERYDVSVHHIAKASKWLVRHGYVSATRGKGGGLKLARKPEEIKIGEVIGRAETGLGLVECMRDGHCAIEGACGLASILDEAKSAFFDTLDRYTLADAVTKRGGLAKMLQLLNDRP